MFWRWFREFSFICVPACTVSFLITQPRYSWSSFAMGAVLGLIPFCVRRLDDWEHNREMRGTPMRQPQTRRTLQ